MKTKFVSTISVLIIGVLAGCTGGTESRIQEKSAVFAALSPEQQQNVKQGVIAIGFTPDMVYMALGKPSTVEPAADGSASAETWTYRNYYPSEAVSDEEIYRKPSAKGPPRSSQSLAAWGNSSLPSSGGAQDPMVNAPASPRSSGGGVVTPSVPAITLQVFFRDGRVYSFKADR